MSTTNRTKRGPGSLNATKARALLKRKAGTLDGHYYAVGLEVPPQRGASFSMRYVDVPSAREGLKLLRQRLSRKRKGMTGHLILAIANEPHYVELAAGVRDRETGSVFLVYPNTTVGWVRRYYRGELPRSPTGDFLRDALTRPTNRATTTPTEPHLRPKGEQARRQAMGR